MVKCVEILSCGVEPLFTRLSRRYCALISALSNNDIDACSDISQNQSLHDWCAAFFVYFLTTRDRSGAPNRLLRECLARSGLASESKGNSSSSSILALKPELAEVNLSPILSIFVYCSQSENGVAFEFDLFVGTHNEDDQ